MGKKTKEYLDILEEFISFPPHLKYLREGYFMDIDLLNAYQKRDILSFFKVDPTIIMVVYFEI